MRPFGLSEPEVFAWFMPAPPPPAPSRTEGCWDWTGTLNTHGYGKVWFQGRDIGAHVLSHIVHLGPTNGLHVLHWCDRRICVQPAHLHLGTPPENIQECVERGRNARGESINTAKLTEADVLRIRELRNSEGLSQEALGKMFGVSQVNVGQILRRKTWKHI